MAEVKLEPITRSVAVVNIEGITPLIPHKWSEKALGMMRDRQTTGTKVRAKHGVKVAEEEAEASLYRLQDGRPGMPAVAFKSAMVSAARLFQGVTMVTLKTALFVKGEGMDQLVPIEGDYEMREDTPRNATGVADLRYRYAFFPWSTTLYVSFLDVVVDVDSVVALVDASGNGGVGDWRPSSPKSATGTYGQYKVVN